MSNQAANNIENNASSFHSLTNIWNYKKNPSNQSDDNYTYTITEYTGCDTIVSVPSIINRHKVTRIAKHTFYHNNNIQEVIIPNTVEQIDIEAFYYCESLQTIDIPSSVSRIGVFENKVELPSFAFDGCIKLRHFNISKDNKEYSSEDGLLFNKSKDTLLAVTQEKEDTFQIPLSVSKIATCTIYGCRKLTSIEIHEGVTEIGRSAFLKCVGLSSINVDPNNKHFHSVNGVLYDKSRSTLLTVPQQQVGVFNICDGISEIGHEAFEGCIDLSSINIPSTVLKIGKEAFSECLSLSSINVTRKNKTYSSEDGVLYNKDKTVLIKVPQLQHDNFSLPLSVKKLAFNSFYGCSLLTRLVIPSSVIEIEDEAFFDCINLKTIQIPSSVKKIGDWSFFGCDNLTIRCNPDSYVEYYCKVNDIGFDYYST